VTIARHATWGVLFAIPAAIGSFGKAGLMVLVTTLLDVDHVLFFSYHNRRLPWSDPELLRTYREWTYFGPRVLIFHNYETLFLLGVGAAMLGGPVVYAFAGVLLHLSLDQYASYKAFRYLRVRTLAGDLVRYMEYRRAVRAGKEREYMLHRRDSWWCHLQSHLSDAEQLRKILDAGGILAWASDVPLGTKASARQWKGIF